jgi:xylan 1,4-beta-xylosidase
MTVGFAWSQNPWTGVENVPEQGQHIGEKIDFLLCNMNYINLRKYFSETLGQSALSIIHLENGEKTELLSTRVPVKDVPVYLRLNIVGRETWFEWSYDGKVFEAIGNKFDTTKFSDEYSNYGEFTGCFVGITCADRVKHQHYADFDFFEYLTNDSN